MDNDIFKGQPLDLPQLNNWFFELVPNFDRKLPTYNQGKKPQHLVILGDINNSKKFKDGSFIKTSYIKEVNKEGNVLTVKTVQGETYLLLFPDSVLELSKPKIRNKLVAIFKNLLPGEFADDITKVVNKTP
jgi:hypothetical protein